MSIASIQVQDNTGTPIGNLVFIEGGTAQVASSFLLYGSGGVSYSRATSEYGITLEVTTDTQLLNAASSSYMSGGLLTRINGVSPTPDGNFFIQGGACDSVWMTAGVSGGTVSLYDLCPACQTCDKVYTLTKAAEYYKIWMNMLKDVNLYNNTRTSTRRGILVNKRTARNTACSITTSPVTVQDDPTAIKGLQLFHEYVTTVQMWNYVVSRRGTQTQITTAPEDDCGFVVQTKYALPACNTNNGELPTLKCTITVQCTDYPKSNRVRVIAFDAAPTESATEGDCTQYPDKRVAYRDAYVLADGTEVSSSSATFIRWVAGKYTEAAATAERISCFTPINSYGIGAPVYSSPTGESAGVVYSYNPFSLYMPPISATYTPTGFNAPGSDVTSTSTIEVLGGSITQTTSGGVLVYKDTSDVDRKVTIEFRGPEGSEGTTGLQHAGVYNVTLKLLPFVKTNVYSVDSANAATEIDFDTYASLWNGTSDTPISSTISGVTSSGTETTYYLDTVPVMRIMGGTITSSGGALEDDCLPTAADYNGAKTYPSRSPENADSGASVLWKVDIDWSLDNTTVTSDAVVIAGGTSVYSEHYVYEAAGAREYIDGLFYKTQLITQYTTTSANSN